MPVLRPLPARPSLKYARKEAKALLRLVRAGDSSSPARARECQPEVSPENARLADAQFVVAREHGFASWPKLVRYMGDVERQQKAHVQLHGERSHYESLVKHLLTQHRDRANFAGRAFAAYIPRFYGLSVDEAFGNEVTVDDARLAVARTYGAPSWEVLLNRVARDVRTRIPAWEIDPMRRAAEAMATSDIDALERIVITHPDLLNPSENDRSAGRTLMMTALAQEGMHGVAALQSVMGWLAAHGFDRQRELDARLAGHVWMTVDEVNDLLERGANPNWVSPNGIPVLEHALLRYWNGDAVDVLAARTKPRDAFWIAAGLGDVHGLSRFLDRNGKPTSAARHSRPDFIAVGARGIWAQIPDPDDEELLIEALLVAVLNGRTRVIEYLASRGAPVNSLVFGMPLIVLAAANGLAAAAESLVRSGADIDLEGSQQPTARIAARDLYLDQPYDVNRRRIVEVFGMNPDSLLAERDAQPARAPIVAPNLNRALMFATADAVRLGKAEVGIENLLFGLLRNERQALWFLKDVGRMDVERFRADQAERLHTSEPAADEQTVPLHFDAQSAYSAATAHATARRSEVVGELELLQALLRDDEGAVGTLIARYGVDLTEFTSALDDYLGRMGPVRAFRKAKS